MSFYKLRPLLAAVRCYSPGDVVPLADTGFFRVSLLQADGQTVIGAKDIAKSQRDAVRDAVLFFAQVLMQVAGRL